MIRNLLPADHASPIKFVILCSKLRNSVLGMSEVDASGTAPKAGLCLEDIPNDLTSKISGRKSKSSQRE